MVINAARYHADEATFSAELQQLGLPKEHSAALCRVYFASDLVKYLTQHSFMGKLDLAYAAFDRVNQMAWKNVVINIWDTFHKEQYVQFD